MRTRLRRCPRRWSWRRESPVGFPGSLRHFALRGGCLVNWSDAKDLRVQLARSWERGDILREALPGTSRFPWRLSFKAPTSADITHRFDEVRAWATALSTQNPLQLEWQETRHRVQGAQRLPSSASVRCVDDALDWLGKRREWNRFCALVAETRQARVELLAWLERRPLQALELADAWTRLLAVVGWFIAHPRPGIYLRQVDLPGIHSKFVEAHRGVLTELLDLALPAGAVNPAKAGIGQFAGRYGLLDKPMRIRFRVLDPELALLSGPACPDITLDADSFGRLQIDVQRVFITENETNFLAFPTMKKAIVVFGAGYGWDALARSRWLLDCPLLYWGDIDTHGFAILNQLRGQFAHVSSILMDRETLLTHEAHWGTEEKPSQVDLPSLTVDERALYDDLRDNRIRKGLRLEQERIAYGWVQRCLQRVSTGR